MTTRGVKRLASASVSSPSTAFTSDARKRLRHGSLSDAVRRTAKKRADAAQKAQGRPMHLQMNFIILIWPRTRKAMQRKSSSAVHETHNQFSKLPRLAPAELSRLKAEKDLKNTQDIAMARKIQDEQIRQNLLQREQTQRAGAGLPVRRKIFPFQNVTLKVSLGRSTPSSPTTATRPAAIGIANTNASNASATSSATACPSANGANTTAPGPTTTPGPKPAPKCRCCSSQSSYQTAWNSKHPTSQ